MRGQQHLTRVDRDVEAEGEELVGHSHRDPQAVVIVVVVVIAQIEHREVIPKVVGRKKQHVVDLGCGQAQPLPITDVEGFETRFYELIRPTMSQTSSSSPRS